MPDEMEVTQMAEQTASVRLLLDPDVYREVKHAAVDEDKSANAWIRAAVDEKLRGRPDDAALARVCGVWASLKDEGRAKLLDAAEVLAMVPEFRRPPEA